MFEYNKSIIKQFENKSVKIFGKNLVFAFICGSFARKKLTPKSDLDMFICVKKINQEEKIKFHKWYLSIHSKHNLDPDLDFGEEIMTYDKLISKIEKIKNYKPSTIINERDIYDGIVWAGMLSGKQIGLFGNKTIFNKLKNESFKICNHWIKNISKFSKSKNPDLILKKMIKYKSEKITNKKSFIKEKCTTLANIIKNEKNKIIDVLLKYESYETANYEISHTIDCLKNIDEELNNITSGKVKTICTFFPLNLPLYSLILFAIIPSFMSNKLFIREPENCQTILQEIYKILKLDKKFPNILSANINRNVFLECYAKTADVIIFTGKYENFIKVKEKCPRSFLIYNGAGINPIVISKSANLDLAISKTIEMRIFNSGQDCAGPDAILVDKTIYEKFIKKLCKKLSKIKVGLYYKNGNRIGKLCDYNQISIVSRLFDKYRDKIDYGGIINFNKYIIYPTVISTKNKKDIGYFEFFSPIFFVIKYKNKNDLSEYFNNIKYKDHAMYISLFGNLKYLENNKQSIILKNKIVNDVEKGNLPYGGYGKKASLISYKNKFEPRPILISKEISNYLKNKK
jgi:acyl-CoA reductase-like NAD-dependent aldehyde dehydrogenase/predicted nucleotidyltransferase